MQFNRHKRTDVAYITTQAPADEVICVTHLSSTAKYIVTLRL